MPRGSCWAVMNRRERHAGIAAAVAAAAAGMLAAGCGGAATAPHPSTGARVSAVPLDTSVASPAGTWATVVMGGSAAQYNNFWQLLIRPAGAAAWKVVTPPGTADNGGLVLAAGAGQSAVTAFRPSQYLTYTPLTETSNGGKAWSALSPLDAALASTPGALAMRPGGGLLSLTAAGTVEQAGASSGAWKTLATANTVAATPAGRLCALRGLTAAAYGPTGVPLLAGACSRPGTAGIFAEQNGTWQAAGPALPAALAGQDITVLQLVSTGSQMVALMQVGSGHSASLLAAWSGAEATRWTVSPPYRLGGAGLASASFGSAGTAAVITTGGIAAVITSAAGPWHSLPALPSGTATLAPGTGGQADALAVRNSTLTVWQLAPGGTAWTKMQVIAVPIQYGSSA